MVCIVALTLITRGGYLGMVWLYGVEVLPISLGFWLVPALTGAIGAVVAGSASIVRRSASAVVFTMTVTAIITVVIFILSGHARAESLIIIPFAGIAALGGSFCDWWMTKKPYRRLTTVGWIAVGVVTAVATAGCLSGAVHQARHGEAL